MLEKSVKAAIVEQFGANASDTGSAAVQVGLLNERIRKVSGHLKVFPKDFHSRHGLIKMVGQRKRFLTYLKRTNASLFEELGKKLDV